MNEKEFKQNTFKVLGMIADIYYQNPEQKNILIYGLLKAQRTVQTK